VLAAWVPSIFSVLTPFAFLRFTLRGFLNGERNLEDFSENCFVFCWHPPCVELSQRWRVRRWSMTAMTDGREMEVETKEMVSSDGAGSMEELAADSERAVGDPPHVRLPWIGGLGNPRVGPMLVINGSGYLVPLCTAGDLLRGCKKFWRAAWD
jgi:hypothetical protein